jgi:hypothetical protein
MVGTEKKIWQVIVCLPDAGVVKKINTAIAEAKKCR